MKSETVLMAQIEAVREKDMDELVEQFRDLYGFECGDTSIHHLRRRIIYRLQELFYGGVSEADLELLDRIADRDPLANLKRSRKKNPMRIAGTKLFRVYRGKQYEVTIVRDKEFVFNGETYKSLSAIARKITGMRWNGKQFFGGEIMKKVRCAIYCRKSVEKGLDMEFNTLDAQREAGEAYVASQKANGWVCLPEHYDDGGFSGGNLNRPALQKLLKDCEAGKVDVIVVYKIDRLSRSLCDFADLSRSFEKWNVAFVSVTQEINTQTSAGRMMLNILMTFAQFEREMIATRVKDKMAATRKKGKWVGGQIPFGYKVENKKLVIDPEKAAVVRRIFQRYLEIQSPITIVRELAADGIVGVTGLPMDKAYILRVLHNYVYIGKVHYDGEVYDGEHEAIVDQATWDTVQRFLQENNPRPDRSRDSTSEAALAGLVRCEHCHSAMVPVKSQRRGRVYPYYRCLRSMKADTDCPIKAVPAGEIEAIVLRQMKSVVQAPEVIAGVTKLTGLSTKTIHDTFKERFWAELTPAEKQRLMHLLVERVAINDDGVDIEFKTSEIKSVKEVYSEQESA